MKTLFTILMIWIFLEGSAQTAGKAKLYGYKESVSSGSIPKKTYDENGKEIISGPQSGMNYLIYLESDSRVYPSEMWIDGQPYSVSINSVNTPVIRMNDITPSDPVKTELVPATTRKVVNLIPYPPVDDKLTDKGRSLAEENELVVIYKMNGKFFYNVIKELKEIEPVSAQ